MKHVVIIGGGAAGYFCAINLAEKQPDLRISIVEKSGKLLSKVRISGGGRCNVTHHCFDNELLIKNYPRGHRELRQVFSRFSTADAVKWFEAHGVKLKAEHDGRMFPVTDDSETVISCFQQCAADHGIRVLTHVEVLAIIPREDILEIATNEGTIEAHYVVCASGGHPSANAYAYIKKLGHLISPPIPSLFTFNLPGEEIRAIQGVVVQETMVSIAGTPFSFSGPTLITHWGLSGPAVLRLSAFGAEALHEKNYKGEIIVNWAAGTDNVYDELMRLQKDRPKILLRANPSFSLPRRLWEYFCDMAGLDDFRNLAETPGKKLKELSGLLSASKFQLSGKTTFKEEFVTCGGVALKEVNFRTMESRIVPRLYFCGEVLNYDGITGGFNFQGAWSTAWSCAEAIAARCSES